MKPKLLLTSFQTWLPHQQSNCSDDLLKIVQQQKFNLPSKSSDLTFLRQLPVNTEQASLKTIAAIKQVKPHGIICCGMAESRKQLTIESRANYAENCLLTKVNLEELINQLSNTAISNHAGRFVCEGLYYRILEYIEYSQRERYCIFVHVPLLTQDNFDLVKKDFYSTINFMVKTILKNKKLSNQEPIENRDLIQ